MQSFNKSIKQSKSQANAAVQQVQDPVKAVVNNRPSAVKQRKLQAQINNVVHMQKPTFIDSLPIQRLVESGLAAGTAVNVISASRRAYIVSENSSEGKYIVDFNDSKSERKAYPYNELDELTSATLDRFNKAPDYIADEAVRINSFAFAQSDDLPIYSESYESCIGVIVHDRQNSRGAMAHIDHDALDDIAEKGPFVAESVNAMIGSLGEVNHEQLSIHVFAGSGIIETKDGAVSSAFKTNFENNLNGIKNTQLQYITYDVDGNHHTEAATYYPKSGGYYLKDRYDKSTAWKPETYDREGEEDFEDSEENKDLIREGNGLIHQVRFGSNGKEIEVKTINRSN